MTMTKTKWVARVVVRLAPVGDPVLLAGGLRYETRVVEAETVVEAIELAAYNGARVISCVPDRRREVR